jgi:hypothetical protein
MDVMHLLERQHQLEVRLALGELTGHATTTSGVTV